MSHFRCLLVDIEGTTTPISFVHEKLFPLARERLEDFLRLNWTRPEVQDSVQLIRQQAAADIAAGAADCPAVPEPTGTDFGGAPVRNAVAANVRWQMASDRKTGGLKQLQGQIWRDAFTAGQVKGAVFDDVPAAFRRCNNAGISVYIYSSGSVEAQKLIFTYSQHGDMQPMFAGNFDTAIGAKTVSDSYTRIAEQIGLPPNDILFLSDNTKEVAAAIAAGMQTAVLSRPGNAPLTEQDEKQYRVLTSFESIAAQ
ncbi:HAD-like domain-containing protein [Thamnocephalis sphaerospora]|uniref:HAD-like domain-containing protein n=1 Tax=Thamnocephalis sphaerospora TaxID=78915 RepID=A0A4P9XRG6_9FUNG|nr:HAD-like domain-containing protein [Thamnocephalis sphaerospora]|eukprot:RKP08687.1 HAD-like domain-containing protein [Thamnocephalis sphaerospora]